MRYVLLVDAVEMRKSMVKEHDRHLQSGKTVHVAAHADARTAAPKSDWEDRGTTGGVREHRLLKKSGPTKFKGSGKRYAKVYEHGNGDVFGESHDGYTRKFKSVDEAKEHLSR